jgi:hypothetical protein
MHMRLTRTELLTITGHTEHGFNTKQRRGQWAMAYSRRDAGARDWYRPEDAVAVQLTVELAKTFGATQAASLVLMFGGSVLRAISAAEHSATDALVGVVELARDSDGRPAVLACSTTDVGVEGYTVARVVTVNISRLVRAVRASAERAGIDLSDVFMPASGSAALDAIMAGYAELDLIVEASARRQRLAAARQAGELARRAAMGVPIGAGRRKASAAQAAA